MKKQLIFILMALLCFTACRQKPSENMENGSAALNVKDTIEGDAVKTVAGFLHWYRENMQQLNRINMVKNSDRAGDTSVFYSVDFQATEKYLKELEKGGFLSADYLNAQRKYFMDCEDYFKKNPENDGPPHGFDYDLIMLSQEYDEALAHLEKAQMSLTKAGATGALVRSDFGNGYSLTYTLNNKNGKWLIDQMENTSGR